MIYTNVFLMRRIAAFVNGTTERDVYGFKSFARYKERRNDSVRNTVYKVCKEWRNTFKLHLWVAPTSAFKKAVEARNLILANALWDYSGDSIDCTHDLFVFVCTNGILRVAKQMLQNCTIDPWIMHISLARACENGYLEVVKRLMQDQRITLYKQDDAILPSASANGYVEIVDWLLKDGRINPAARHTCSSVIQDTKCGCGLLAHLYDCSNNVTVGRYAICLASANGHVEVIERLLQDQRVDSSVDCCVSLAKQNGQIEVIKLFLKRKRDDNAAVAAAAGN